MKRSSLFEIEALAFLLGNRHVFLGVLYEQRMHAPVRLQEQGLGLYLSRELVERHGGRLWFESAEGKGSTFFMTLPCLKQFKWQLFIG